jgi:hypothetical protein
MFKKGDFSEAVCVMCKQLVPVNAEGKIVKHYKPFHARGKHDKTQPVCAGTGGNTR